MFPYVEITYLWREVIEMDLKLLVELEDLKTRNQNLLEITDRRFGSTFERVSKDAFKQFRDFLKQSPFNFEMECKTDPLDGDLFGDSRILGITAKYFDILIRFNLADEQFAEKRVFNLSVESGDFTKKYKIEFDLPASHGYSFDIAESSDPDMEAIVSQINELKEYIAKLGSLSNVDSLGGWKFNVYSENGDLLFRDLSNMKEVLTTLFSPQ